MSISGAFAVVPTFAPVQRYWVGDGFIGRFRRDVDRVGGAAQIFSDDSAGFERRAENFIIFVNCSPVDGILELQRIRTIIISTTSDIIYSFSTENSVFRLNMSVSNLYSTTSREE